MHYLVLCWNHDVDLWYNFNDHLAIIFEEA